MNRKPYLTILVVFLIVFTRPVVLLAQKAANLKTAYLFTYFTGNGKDQEAIHFALSNDGLKV